MRQGGASVLGCDWCRCSMFASMAFVHALLAVIYLVGVISSITENAPDEQMCEPPILAALYADVTPLRSLLQRHGFALGMEPEVPPTVNELLDSVIVASRARLTTLDHPRPSTGFGVSPRCASWESIGEVVDDAVRQLHRFSERDAWGRVQNVLARGFVLGDGPGSSDRALRQKHDNAAADFFRRVSWTQLGKLLSLVKSSSCDTGGDVRHPIPSTPFHCLLHDCLTDGAIALFLLLPNDCVWQLSGQPLDSVLLAQKRQASQRSLQAGERVSSSLSTASTPSGDSQWRTLILPRHGAPVKLVTNPHMHVCRASIFHCASFGRVAGLPHTHILRQLTRTPPSRAPERQATSLGLDIRSARELVAAAQVLQNHSSTSLACMSADAAASAADAVPSNNARRLLRHVFVDALHLRDVEALNGARSSAMESAVGDTNLPKHLKECVPLFRELLGRFQRTDLARLLRQHCPLPAPAAHPASVSLLAAPLSLQVPAPAVMGFVRAALHAIVPPALLGDGRMHRALLTLVWRWVRAGSKDSIALGDIQTFLAGSRGRLEALDPDGGSAACATAAPYSTWRSPATRSTVFPGSGLRAGQERILCWAVWILLCMVSPLLVSHFYITTSEATGSDTVYFRKPVWARLTRQAVQDLVTRLQLQPLDAAARARCRAEWELNSYAFVASVRLYPKRAGMRPIMNLSRTLTEEATAGRARSGGPAAAPTQSVVRAGSWSAHSAATSTSCPPSRAFSGATSLSRRLSSGSSNTGASKAQWADRPLNTVLRPLLSVLQHEQRGQRRLMGSAISGLQGVHAALRRWARLAESGPAALAAAAASVTTAAGSGALAASGEPAPPPACSAVPPPAAPPARLYVVSCDVQHAFDVMRQRVLLTISDRLLPPCVSHYSLARYAHIDVSPASRRDVAEGRGGATHDKPSPALSPLELRVRWLTTVEREGDGSVGAPFSERVMALAARHRGAVFVDSVERSRVPRERLSKLLHNHLVRQAVLLPDRRVYSQHSGIPQGSVLSAMLCNLYLGHMERHALLPAIAHQLPQRARAAHSPYPPALGPVLGDEVPSGQQHGCLADQTTKPEGLGAQGGSGEPPTLSPARSSLLAAAARSPLIMRGMDDFICITGQRDFAVAFLRAFSGGFGEYACYASAHKTAHNIDGEVSLAVGKNGVEVVSSSSSSSAVAAPSVGGSPPSFSDARCHVPWFGLSVDSLGRIAVDLSRICGDGVLGRGLVLRSTPPNLQYLRRQFFLALRPKCHALLLDCRLSTLPAIIVNLYQLALLACARVLLLLHHHLTWVGRGNAGSGSSPVGSLGELWEQCAQICTSLVMSACRQACNGCALHGSAASNLLAVATAGGAVTTEPKPLLQPATRPTELRVLLGAHDWVDLQQVRSSWLAVTSSVPLASDSGELDMGHVEDSACEVGCTCVQCPLQTSEVRAVFGHALSAVLAFAHPAVRDGSRGLAAHLARTASGRNVRAEVAAACVDAARISAPVVRALDQRSRR